MLKKVIIVGSDEAGMSAAISSFLSGKTQVYLITKTYDPVPFISRFKGYPISFYPKISPKCINVILGSENVELFPKEKTVVVRTKSEESHISYNSIILSTGVTPITPLIEGIGKRGVYNLWRISVRNIDLSKASKVVIYGAGIRAINAAETIAKMGKKVLIVDENKEILLHLLDPSMALKIRKYLEAKGIKFELESKIERVLGYDEVTGVEIRGAFYETDKLLIDLGVTPNSRILKRAGGKTGVYNGIVVDDYLMTTLPNVLAAGGCCELLNLGLNIRKPIPLKCVAKRSGLIAGINAIRGRYLPAKFVRNIVTILDDLELISVGGTKYEAERHGVSYEEVKIDTEYAQVSILLSLSGAILGVQMVGKYILPLVNPISILIKEGATLNSFLHLDLSLPYKTSNILNIIMKEALKR